MLAAYTNPTSQHHQQSAYKSAMRSPLRCFSVVVTHELLSQ
eukprot:SAG31_NODE_30105_length_385_cov_0.898601_1_plen_40_part_10